MRLVPSEFMMPAVAATSPPPNGPAPQRGNQAWGLYGFVAVAILWSFWPALATMAERWHSDPQYSHGYLVPVFAAVILWLRRDQWDGKREPYWLGIPILLISAVLRWGSATMDVGALDSFALIVAVMGTTLLVGGRKMFAWAWPAIAFLGFMLPLPYSIETALRRPLQRWATVASTYVLQTIGYPALAEGNIIRIDEIRLGVLDACNGLGMLMTFFALSTALAMTLPAPRLDRWILVFSAIPIALISNILRIVATALAYSAVSKEFGDMIMHDFAGWLMMPVALGLAWLELKLLAKIFPLDSNASSSDRPLGPSLVSSSEETRAWRLEVPLR